MASYDFDPSVLGPFSAGRGSLVGLVVEVSASRAEDPGFDSCLRRGDYSGSSHTSDLQIGTSVTTLPDAWRSTVSAGTGWPVSVYCDWVR